MKTIRLVRHSFRMMGRFKARTTFMMLGSIIGIGVLTFVISVGQTAQRKTVEMVRQMFGDSGILIRVKGGEMMGGPRDTGTRLNIDDIAALAKEVPGVTDWDPVQTLTAMIRHGDATDNATVLGESERWPQVWDRTASQGDLFDQAAVNNSARVAIIGETVAKRLFGSEDPIGADIQIGSVPFKVIGILEAWGTNPHGMDRDNEIVVPISTLLRRLTNTDTIAGATLLVSDPERSGEMGAQMRTILRERHGLSADEPDAFIIITPLQTRRMVATVQSVLFFYLPLVAAIALFVGAVISAALMIASVNGRVAEIGLRRAVGAQPRDIRRQFLLETMITIVVGGLVGIAIGYSIALFGAIQMHLGSVSPSLAALLGIAASSLVGLLAGVLPALRAARLNPAEALR